jgi:hypothetical protein
MFKPRRINKRLLSIKKKLEESMIIDHIKKTLVVNKDLHYIECLVLEKYYQGYKIDVNGDVCLAAEGLKQLPKILFRKVKGGFYCTHNNLVSLKHSPKRVDGNFRCSYNKLVSLKGCPKKVKGYFWCNQKDKIFTEEEINENCEVLKQGNILKSLF